MFLLVTLFACTNACQNLCNEMADYAQTDCGLTVSDDELKQCLEDQSSVDGDQNQQCASVSDPDYIRQWWTCDQLAENFQDGAN